MSVICSKKDTDKEAKSISVTGRIREREIEKKEKRERIQKCYGYENHVSHQKHGKREDN